MRMRAEEGRGGTQAVKTGCDDGGGGKVVKGSPSLFPSPPLLPSSCTNTTDGQVRCCEHQECMPPKKSRAGLALAPILVGEFANRNELDRSSFYYSYAMKCHVEIL